LRGQVGDLTFNGRRYLNQDFYIKSKEWKEIRQKVILRDSQPGMDYCYDLGHKDYPIIGRIYVHHIEPLLPEDFVNKNLEKLLDMENLICVSQRTHEAIHYGDESLLFLGVVERQPNDTVPWR
jgi:hypothetical protein